METNIVTFFLSLTSADRAVLALGSAWIFYLFSRTRGRMASPFGPRPLPFVGNMFQIPQKNEWPTFEAWAMKYGGCSPELPNKKHFIL